MVGTPFYSPSFSDFDRNKLLSVMFAEIKHLNQSHILVLILLDHQKFLLNTLIISSPLLV